MLSFWLPHALVAQTSSDLKNKRKKLQNKINYTNKLIKETRSNQQLSHTELVLLNKKIGLQEEKVRNIGYEIRHLNRKISETASIIVSTEEDLRQLKEEYAAMIRAAYKTQSSYDKLLWIFAADDLNQAYYRLKYMQSYAELRKQQSHEIVRYRKLLEGQIAQMKNRKTKRKNLLTLQISEQDALQVMQTNQQQALHFLHNQEEKLREQLQSQERDKAKLNEAIAYAIKKEVEAAKNRNKGTYALTPEARLESSRFEKNKGKLPWPVERGLITSTFGEHPHPSIPGLKVKNNGIDILTSKGADARAIFEGEVRSVIVISGAGKTVMIRHGGYFSAYSNLKEVYVKKGDKVTTRQGIGTLLTDASKTISHLEIWKISNNGTLSKENPSHWIFQK